MRRLTKGASTASPPRQQSKRDPIFGLIEDHKARHAFTETQEDDEAVNQASGRACKAWWKMIDTAPRSVAGEAARAKYVAEIAAREECPENRRGFGGGFEDSAATLLGRCGTVIELLSDQLHASQRVGATPSVLATAQRYSAARDRFRTAIRQLDFVETRERKPNPKRSRNQDKQSALDRAHAEEAASSAAEIEAYERLVNCGVITSYKVTVPDLLAWLEAVLSTRLLSAKFCELDRGTAGDIVARATAALISILLKR